MCGQFFFLTFSVYFDVDFEISSRLTDLIFPEVFSFSNLRKAAV